MKDLEKYTRDVTDDMDSFFAEMMKDSSYRNGVNAEKNKLASAAAVLKARESAGLSQQGLADKSGVPKSTISRIEKGNNTSIETLTKIANALDKKVKLVLS
ncbi:helix-turn-helix domain-containing protein [Lentilactobacillus sp. G22-6]|uniref:helix-turn-helix domain-containing protein n=1 Tax=Lentilactobacillus dabitei TaxID=2831523 RepID=UPI001C26AD51|nr:helix-turn-helix transcriptional regulator [Lentilactobacillus dabitei]MBU9789426.1 helix-turn-helix domain-containing protein [Lentilactobacillus dabitei]